MLDKMIYTLLAIFHNFSKSILLKEIYTKRLEIDHKRRQSKDNPT